MHVAIKRLKTEWSNLTIALRVDEVDELIRRLTDLRSGRLGHIDLWRDDWGGQPAVANIEISISGGADPDNMRLSRPYPRF